MSSVSGITSQLNNTNSCNTCDNSDILNRLQKVEGVNGTQENHLQSLDGEFSGIDGAINVVKTIVEGEIKIVGAAVDGIKQIVETIGHTVEGEIHAVEGLVHSLENLVGAKADRGELESIRNIAQRALQVAEPLPPRIEFLEYRTKQFEQVLPVISERANSAIAKADQAYALADKAASQTLDLAHRLESTDIEVHSLRDRISKLENATPLVDLNKIAIAELKAELEAAEALIKGILIALATLQAEILLLAFKKGDKGDKGDKGEPGLKGDKGDTGLKGDRGDTGLKGDRGDNGYPGATGAKGDPGYPGANGINGINGQPGFNGAPGINGINGLPGFNGTNGLNGIPGLNGNPGINGLDGAPGLNGLPGTNGATGANGAPGTPGTAGAPGTNGATGATGAPGANGKNGVNGNIGATGAPGKDGVDAEVKFSTIEVKVFDECGEDDQPKFKTATVSVIKGTELTEQANFEQIAIIAAQSCQVTTTEITVKVFDTCNGETAIYREEKIRVIKGTETGETMKFKELAEIEAQKCRELVAVAVATVPEWWQLRPEAARPQAVLVFRQLKPDGTLGGDNYPITIPHFKSDPAPTFPPLTEYEKGNFEGILTLKDNSKLIVHCVDAAECKRVIDIFKQSIDSAFLVGSNSKIGERKGQPFKQVRAKAVRLDYYPTGVKSLKPKWIKAYV